MAAVLGVLLRNYGFTDLPPSLSLPLPRSDPVTRICESSYRRAGELPTRSARPDLPRIDLDCNRN